jgi:UPF0042 nucleotide-binding protein
MTDPSAVQHVVFVTGPSGAGRSSAINVLEDLGFEAIDNIPLRLVPRLLDAETPGPALALGIDARNRDFAPDDLLALMSELQAKPGVKPELLFLDCRPDVLLRRFSETRRRHPLAPRFSPSEGIDLEEALLKGVREQSDYLIDTSDLTPHELRDRLRIWFEGPDQETLAVSVQSFSYKKGLPQGVDMILDCRFLDNPHWVPELRAKTGLDGEVSEFVQRDPKFPPFLDRVMDLMTFLLPSYRDEGKAHFSVAFGCTGGQHRSVTMAETVAAGLAHAGWRVSIRHIEMERKGRVAPSQGVDTTFGDRQA